MAPEGLTRKKIGVCVNDSKNGTETLDIDRFHTAVWKESLILYV